MQSPLVIDMFHIRSSNIVIGGLGVIFRSKISECCRYEELKFIILACDFVSQRGCATAAAWGLVGCPLIFLGVVQGIVGFFFGDQLRMVTLFDNLPFV